MTALTAAGVTGTAILPVITTRRAETTLQLYDGQSFAIGGTSTFHSSSANCGGRGN